MSVLNYFLTAILSPSSLRFLSSPPLPSSPSPSPSPCLRPHLQDNKEGSSCAFTCNDGYHMSAGSATRTCTAATSTIFSGDEVICTKCPIGKYKDSPTNCATLSSLKGGSSSSGGSSTSGGSSANTTATTGDDSARITTLESLIAALFCLVVLSVCMLVWLYKKSADQERKMLETRQQGDAGLP